MEILTYTLPEYLACYLINNDLDTMTEQEKNEIDNFLQEINCYCVGCSENSFFTWKNDLNHLGATCLEFYFIKNN